MMVPDTIHQIIQVAGIVLGLVFGFMSAVKCYNAGFFMQSFIFLQMFFFLRFYKKLSLMITLDQNLWILYLFHVIIGWFSVVFYVAVLDVGYFYLHYLA